MDPGCASLRHKQQRAACPGGVAQEYRLAECRCSMECQPMTMVVRTSKHPGKQARLQAHLDVRHLPLAMQEPRPVLLRTVCLDDDQDDVPVADTDFALFFVDFLRSKAQTHVWVSHSSAARSAQHLPDHPAVAVFLPPKCTQAAALLRLMYKLKNEHCTLGSALGRRQLFLST